AGLPSVSRHQPAPDVPIASDLTVADLALTVLSFIGRQGPPGLLLVDVRKYFTEHPEHVRLLARYSLECGTLITPAVVPFAEETYQRYEAAIGQWITLRDAHKVN